MEQSLTRKSLKVLLTTEQSKVSNLTKMLKEQDKVISRKNQKIGDMRQELIRLKNNFLYRLTTSIKNYFSTLKNASLKRNKGL